jgi:hypothetical protein
VRQLFLWRVVAADVVVVGTRVVPHRSCFLESGKRVFLVIA